MSNDFSFHTMSYFSGIISGLVIKWTDIIPLTAGFCLGLMVKKMPEFVNMSELPIFVQNYLQYFKNIGNGTNNISKSE